MLLAEIKKIKNLDKIILGLIIGLAVLLRFWNLPIQDLVSDDALYSFRAYGWIDFLGGQQTTPIQWFGQIPWWANLSFHDTPPLVYAIQFLFFKLLGSSTFVARLPFALAGVGVVLLAYYFIRKLKNEAVALISALLLALSSYQVWASRTGYLEGLAVFFIVLSFFFFVRYLVTAKNQDLWFWGLAVGLSLMCKYTAMFLLPAAIIYILIWQRKLLLNKNFYIALALMLVVLSPVIFYNVEVFLTRGHLDASLAPMVGTHPDDFSGLKNLKVSNQYLANAESFFRILFNTASVLLLSLSLAAVLYLIIKLYRRRGDGLEKFLLSNILMIFLMFLFAGPVARRLSIIAPFLMIASAIFIFDAYIFFQSRNKKLPVGFIIVIVLIIFGEGFYSFNTNATIRPVFKSPLFYSSARFYNAGFTQLDSYLKEKAFSHISFPKRIKNLDDLKINFESLAGKNVILFDDTINWFPFSWYLQRWLFYYNYPVISWQNYLQSAGQNSTPFTLLEDARATGFYYIFAVGDKTLDPVGVKNEALRNNVKMLAQDLEKNGYTPKEIKDSQGNIAFKVYYVRLN